MVKEGAHIDTPQILQGDNLHVLPTLPENSFHTCITSPPYWGLRDYDIPPSEWPEVTYTPMPGLQSITVPAWTGCLGLEPTPEMFVAHSVHVFRHVWRVLRDDGTLWLNYGDSYSGSNKGRWGDGAGVVGTKPMQSKARTSGTLSYSGFESGLKPKDLIGIPWRVAFALQADGWYLRMDNVWSKPNPMPESVGDRPTKSHEYVFLLSKSERYYYDKEAVLEPLADSSIARLSQNIDAQPGSKRANGGTKSNGTMKAVKSGNKTRKYGEDRDRPGSHLGASIPWEGTMRNKRSVWTIPTAQFSEAHFAVMPDDVAETGVLAGAPVGGAVLDPFGGSGTVYKVAVEQNRVPTIIEIGQQYVEIAERRTKILQPIIQF